MIIPHTQSSDSAIIHLQKYHARMHANLKGRSYLLKARRNNPIINFDLIGRKMDIQKIDRRIKSLGYKVIDFIKESPEIKNEEDFEIRGALIISLLLALLGSFCKDCGHDEQLFKQILQQAVDGYRED